MAQAALVHWIERALGLSRGRSSRTEAADDWDVHFMRLTTRLTPALREGRRSLAFLSSHRGEGTTTMAKQLALKLSMQGRQRVLVIDANLRHPSLHRRLGAVRGPGLAEFLSGRIHLDHVTQRLSRLHLIAAGRSKHDPVMLLESPRFAEALERKVQDYDCVLIDAPAFVDHPETEALLQHVDACVLVAEAGRTRPPVARSVAEAVRDSGSELLGTVLNKRRFAIPERIYRLL